MASSCKGKHAEGTKMDSTLKRRISIATCWASSRIALMDSVERYEDSYAITQEFREWIICLENQKANIDKSLLIFPSILTTNIDEQTSIPDIDEVVEL